MSYRLVQIPPQASTRSMRVPVRWMGLDGCLGGSGFLSSWLDDDDDGSKPRRFINWGAISGLGLSLVISGAFWAGVGVLIAHYVR